MTLMLDNMNSFNYILFALLLFLNLFLLVMNHFLGKGKGGKSSGLMERWMCSQKRRSARVRSTVRREEPSLARSLAQLIPNNLL